MLAAGWAENEPEKGSVKANCAKALLRRLKNDRDRCCLWVKDFRMPRLKRHGMSPQSRKIALQTFLAVSQERVCLKLRVPSIRRAKVRKLLP